MTTVGELKVLIAEDSADVRARLVALVAEVPGVEIVGEAEDEAGAIVLYDEHQPDAAVLDIRLRDGSGIGVLAHIKRQNRHCVVMILNNWAHAEFRLRCRQAGADFFFEKSREFHQVAVILREMLRRRLAGPE